MLTSLAVIILGVLIIAEPVNRTAAIVFGVVVAVLALADLVRGHIRVP